jgi:hypothetical protein
MKISKLQQEVKEKSLEYQKNSNKFWDKKTDSLSLAFDWENTKEDKYYWEEWGRKKINIKNLLEKTYDKISKYLFGGINCNPKG